MAVLFKKSIQYLFSIKSADNINTSELNREQHQLITTLDLYHVAIQGNQFKPQIAQYSGTIEKVCHVFIQVINAMIHEFKVRHNIFNFIIEQNIKSSYIYSN